MNRNDLLAKIPNEQDLPTKLVPSERFGDIRIRQWTCDDKDRWEQGTMDIDTTAEDPKDRIKMKLAGSRALMFILSVCDDQGKLLLTEEDALTIGRVPAADMDPIIDAIRTFNGMTPEEAEALAKNSLTSPSSADPGE